MKEHKSFNIRVYGLLIQDGYILLADEIINGYKITKFPGGGLEWGEGAIDCLKREWKEETGMDVDISSHFYTTDFFQQSAFDQSDQVISIYYYVDARDLSDLRTVHEKFQFKQQQEDEEVFRWHPCNRLTADDLSMPIDQVVAKMMTEPAE